MCLGGCSTCRRRVGPLLEQLKQNFPIPLVVLSWNSVDDLHYINCHPSLLVTRLPFQTWKINYRLHDDKRNGVYFIVLDLDFGHVRTNLDADRRDFRHSDDKGKHFFDEISMHYLALSKCFYSRSNIRMMDTTISFGPQLQVF